MWLEIRKKAVSGRDGSPRGSLNKIMQLLVNRAQDLTTYLRSDAVGRALEYRVKQINNEQNFITKPSPFSYQYFKVKVPFRSNKSKDLSNKK